MNQNIKHMGFHVSNAPNKLNEVPFVERAILPTRMSGQVKSET